VGKLISGYSDVIKAHRLWLKTFGKQRTKKWEDFLKSNPEGAICEAATRKLLSEHEVKVEPYEDPSRGGPDFRCTKDNKCFYVEVTCISKDAATKETNLSDVPKNKGSYHRLMTPKILAEIRNKTTQCSNLDAPCIIAVGTLHFQAGRILVERSSVEQLLTGTSYIALNFNSGLGHAVGDPYQITHLEDSLFIRRAKTLQNTIEYARSPVSAVLLCNFGYCPDNAIGALHPNPNNAFDRALLSNIEFCKLAEGYQSGQLKVEWI